MVRYGDRGDGVSVVVPHINYEEWLQDKSKIHDPYLFYKADEEGEEFDGYLPITICVCSRSDLINSKDYVIMKKTKKKGKGRKC